MGLPRSMEVHGRHRGHGISMPAMAAMAPMEFHARDGAHGISHAREGVNKQIHIHLYMSPRTFGRSKPMNESLARCSANFLRSLPGLLLI